MKFNLKTPQPAGSWSWLLIVALVVGSYVGGATVGLPSEWPSWLNPFQPAPVVVPAVKVTAVTYFIPNRGSVPHPVKSGLDELNTQGIVATVHEEGTTAADGTIPKQHEHSYPAALKAGLPALVVMAGNTVHKVVTSPTPLTKQQVLEAAK